MCESGWCSKKLRDFGMILKLCASLLIRRMMKRSNQLFCSEWKVLASTPRRANAAFRYSAIGGQEV
jgi:hypothetical protein